MRRLSEALLLALLLLAVQTALLTHDHGGAQAPAGTAALACEFCVGSTAVAPPAAEPPLPVPEFIRAGPAACARDRFPLARRVAAHGSRAPPAFHST